ncbi:MAG: GNAT family N-acetyltransferase [Actinomycetota bacterium]|nr:GNAT family N-acetyltransferase [Actinomycetota bacterium]
MRFTSVPLDQAHDTTAFRCGEDSLDSWLVEHAHNDIRRGTARVWIWREATGRVVAYYSLSASKVSREDVPTKMGRGGPIEIPAVLVGRLALDRSLHGQNLGEVLLADALSRIVDATRTVGARLVVVDALHEKAAVFYERYGFRRVPGSLRLVQKVADIAAGNDG